MKIDEVDALIEYDMSLHHIHNDKYIQKQMKNNRNKNKKKETEIPTASKNIVQEAVKNFQNEQNAGITTHAKRSEASRASAKRVRSEFRTKKKWCEFVRVYASQQTRTVLNSNVKLSCIADVIRIFFFFFS